MSPLEVHRWHELAGASSTVPLSRVELVRFRALLAAVRAVQDNALAMQVRMLRVQRLSYCVYYMHMHWLGLGLYIYICYTQAVAMHHCACVALCVCN